MADRDRKNDPSAVGSDPDVRFSYANERTFLGHVGPAALQAARQSAAGPGGGLIARIRAWLRLLRLPGL